MNQTTQLSHSQKLLKDTVSAVVVFLVALPLCLGIALASGAPLISGVLAGIIGGIIVGILSGSHTSVSGPAAGLTAVVAAQISTLGSFEAFLTAVLIAGIMQIVIGVLRWGSIAEFFPTSVIKGLLAAIGVILILKQIPHLLGHDSDPEGDMAFRQVDQENTFSEILAIFSDFHIGAAVIGIVSLILLIAFQRIRYLKNQPIPAPLIVVLVGTGMKIAFDLWQWGSQWQIGTSHLVWIPYDEKSPIYFGLIQLADLSQLQMADFSYFFNPATYTAAITIALVASLETLLNLEAVDNIDPQQRVSPPNRELIAQGCGNVCAGLFGALPVTSVIIRSSVNINAGGRTKAATIMHGFLLLICAALFPFALNQIPLSCLAAILLMTGIKLASPELVKQMWRGGRYEFIPFMATTIAIVSTDLLVGILLGLAVSIAFILYSNLKRPLKRIMEKHIGGNVLRIELANQVSFLNKAGIKRALHEVEDGQHVLLDARNTVYIDPDVLSLIQEYEQKTAPARNIKVSLLGFRKKYQIEDNIQYVDFSSRDVQEQMTPQQALQILLDGNQRFRTGQQLTRSTDRQVASTIQGQYPVAVVLSCIDSRTPAELIFDMGIGDVFSVRVAGNVTSNKIIGSMEYGCSVAGSKLLLVVGHTQCGAVSAAIELANSSRSALESTGCEHLDGIIGEISRSMDQEIIVSARQAEQAEKVAIVNEIARRNVLRSVEEIRSRSTVLRNLECDGRIIIAGALYDVTTGLVELVDAPKTLSQPGPA